MKIQTINTNSWLLTSGNKDMLLTYTLEKYNLLTNDGFQQFENFDDLTEHLKVSLNLTSKPNLKIDKKVYIGTYEIDEQDAISVENDLNLPAYKKNEESNHIVCAGWYVIDYVRNVFIKQNPRYSTLENRSFKGPFKSREEAKKKGI